MLLFLIARWGLGFCTIPNSQIKKIMSFLDIKMFEQVIKTEKEFSSKELILHFCIDASSSNNQKIDFC